MQAHAALVVMAHGGQAIAHGFGMSEMASARQLPKNATAARGHLRRIIREVTLIDLQPGKPVMAAGAFAAHIGQQLPQHNRCKQHATQKPDGVPVRRMCIGGRRAGGTVALIAGACRVRCRCR